MELKPASKSPTQKVVLGIMGLALVIMAFKLAGPLWGLGLTVILAYEGWTLMNDYKNDTISEILWGLSTRPIVPWLFGVATGWALTSGFVSDVWLVLALGFLQGHFWFQQHKAKNGNGAHS
jgi:hypothetical protein